MGKFRSGVRIVMTASLVFAHPIAPARADTQLPAPYVSRALDAVLMPIDGKVRRAFNLSPKADGVYVVSVQPGGVAAKNDIRPGDVISRVKGKDVVKPIDLDTAVYYWIKHGTTDFVFDGYRGQTIYHPRSSITLALFDAAIDLATIATWGSVSYSGFSYSSYYSEYSVSITESYSSSETTIETTASSESYSSEAVSASEETTSFEQEEASEKVESEESAESEEAEQQAQSDDHDDKDDKDDGDKDDDGGDDKPDDGGDNDSGGEGGGDEGDGGSPDAYR